MPLMSSIPSAMTGSDVARSRSAAPPLPCPRLLSKSRALLLSVIGLYLVVTMAACSSKPPAGLAGAVKISCIDRGVYKVAGKDLKELGVDLRAVDPERMALVHLEESIPFHAVGLEDGRFGAGDAIYFFTEGLLEENIPMFNLKENFEKPAQLFMLHLDASKHEPKRFAKRIEKTPAQDDLQDYPVYLAGGHRHYEDDPIWEFIRGGLIPGQTCDYLFWDKLTYPATDKTNSAVTVPFVMPRVDFSDQITMRVQLIGLSEIKGIAQNVRHHVRIDINGRHQTEVEWINPDQHIAELTVPPRTCRMGENKLTVTLLKPSKTEKLGTTRIDLDMVVFDWFDVDFKQRTYVYDDYNEFYMGEDAPDGQKQQDLKQTEEGNETVTVVPFSIRGFTDDDILLFDMTAQEVVEAKPFKEKASEEWGVNLENRPGKTTLVAMTEPRALAPEAMEKVTIGNLFERPVDCDMLILSNQKFMGTLAPFIEWKRKRGLNVHSVDIVEIFNERSAGYVSPYPLRDYVEHVYRSQPEPKLKYVLLVGDSTNISKYQTFLPSYSFLYNASHTNDNFFANFDDPRLVPQVAVGRFSVRETAELEIIVRKVIDYESGKDRGAWNSRLFMIAASSAWARSDVYKLITDYVQPHYLGSYLTTKQVMANEASQNKLTQELNNNFNIGNLITVFLGHGGGTVWEVGPAMTGQFLRAHLFNQSHVEALTNYSRLPVVFALTCYTNSFDNPHVARTLGETFLNAPGGAIGVIGSTARSAAYMNLKFVNLFLKHLQERTFERLGDYVVQVKEDMHRRDVNQLVVLLGDPSLEFSLPKPELTISNATISADFKTLGFDYELPEAASLPAELNVFVLGNEEKLLHQWTETSQSRAGRIEYLSDRRLAFRRMRMVVYLADGSGVNYSGGCPITNSERENQVAAAKALKSPGP